MANLRAKIELEVVKNDVVYLMYLQQGVPFVDALEVLDEMKAVVNEWQKKSEEDAKLASEKQNDEVIEPEVVS